MPFVKIQILKLPKLFEKKKEILYCKLMKPVFKTCKLYSEAYSGAIENSDSPNYSWNIEYCGGGYCSITPVTPPPAHRNFDRTTPTSIVEAIS